MLNDPPRLVATKDFSQIIGTTPVTVLTGAQAVNNIQYYMRIFNASAATTIWLSRNGSPAAVNAAGSWSLPPGEYEIFQYPSAIPINQLSAVATAAGAQLTVEIG